MNNITYNQLSTLQYEVIEPRTIEWNCQTMGLDFLDDLELYDIYDNIEVREYLGSYEGHPYIIIVLYEDKPFLWYVTTSWYYDGKTNIVDKEIYLRFIQDCYKEHIENKIECEYEMRLPELYESDYSIENNKLEVIGYYDWRKR